MLRTITIIVFCFIEYLFMHAEHLERSIGVKPSPGLPTWSVIPDGSCMAEFLRNNSQTLNSFHACSPPPILSYPCQGDGFETPVRFLLLAAFLFFLVIRVHIPDSMGPVFVLIILLVSFAPGYCFPTVESEETGQRATLSQPHCSFVTNQTEQQLGILQLFRVCGIDPQSGSLVYVNDEGSFTVKLRYQISPEIKGKWLLLRFGQNIFMFIRLIVWWCLFNIGTGAQWLIDMLENVLWNHQEEDHGNEEAAIDADERKENKGPQCLCCVGKAKPTEICQDVWNLVLEYNGTEKKCDNRLDDRCRIHWFGWSRKLFMVIVICFWAATLIEMVNFQDREMRLESQVCSDPNDECSRGCQAITKLWPECKYEPSLIRAIVVLGLLPIAIIMVTSSMALFFFSWIIHFCTVVGWLLSFIPTSCHFPLQNTTQIELAKEALHCNYWSPQIVSRLIDFGREPIPPSGGLFAHSLKIWVRRLPEVGDGDELCLYFVRLMILCLFYAFLSSRWCCKQCRQIDRWFCRCPLLCSRFDGCPICCHSSQSCFNTPRRLWE